MKHKGEVWLALYFLFFFLSFSFFRRFFLFFEREKSGKKKK